jgi:hypothetical protein
VTATLLPILLADQAAVLVTEDIAARLDEHARQAHGALAPETERALRKASAAFSSWAAAQGLPALPTTPETLAAYVDALAGLGRKPASIRQAVGQPRSPSRRAPPSRRQSAPSRRPTNSAAGQAPSEPRPGDTRHPSRRR